MLSGEGNENGKQKKTTAISLISKKQLSTFVTWNVAQNFMLFFKQKMSPFVFCLSLYLLFSLSFALSPYFLFFSVFPFSFSFPFSASRFRLYWLFSCLCFARRRWPYAFPRYVITKFSRIGYFTRFSAIERYYRLLPCMVYLSTYIILFYSIGLEIWPFCF